MGGVFTRGAYAIMAIDAIAAHDGMIHQGRNRKAFS